jgi:hypothetical protein
MISMKRRPSPAMVVAFIALVAALTGSAFAALGKNTVGSKQIKNGSATGKDVKNNSLTGKDVLESSLAKVPSASNADNASSLGGSPPSAYASTALEAVHRVGAAGEPAFENNWTNEGGGFETAGFYKDPFGIVHLVGDVHNGTGATIFTLPSGYGPAAITDFAVRANSDTGTVTVAINTAGQVQQFGYASNRLPLNGLTFRP